MARRSAKAQLPDVRFASVIKAFLCCLLIGGVAVGYVRQTHENSALKIELQTLKDEITERAHHNDRTNKELLILQSPHTLNEIARHRNLDLQPPRPGQVIELEMPGPDEPMIARSGSRSVKGEGGRE